MYFISSTVLKYPILNLTVPLGKVPIVLCARGAQCNPLLLLMLKSESNIYDNSLTSNFE